jgi:hypothetical protein
MSKRLNNTAHTTLNMSTQQPSISIAQSSVSRSDLPYRNLAPYGVLSKYRIDLIFLF